MYVTVDKSSGNAFVNKNTSANGGKWWYRIANVLSTQTDNLYTVNVSAFDASTSNYIIADPRVPASENEVFKFYEIDSDGTNSTERTTATDAAGVKQLLGYRATISGDDSENLIAPEFIIASGYGAYDGVTTNLYADTSGKYRCAGYQEDGYPAGRWRLPTPAELNIIGKMCSEKKLESIFEDDFGYLSSNGVYIYSSDGTFTKSTSANAGKSVRCVYDTWYWGDKLKDDKKTSFIWGAEGNIKNMEEETYNNYFTSVK